MLADKVYGGRDEVRLSDLVIDLDPAKDEVLLARQALHASRLRFTHPRTRQVIEAEAPLPADFERVLAALRQFRPARRSRSSSS